MSTSKPPTPLRDPPATWLIVKLPIPEVLVRAPGCSCGATSHTLEQALACDLLWSLMAPLGFTRWRELANHLHVTQSTLSLWHSGQRRPAGRNRLAVLRAAISAFNQRTRKESTGAWNPEA